MKADALRLDQLLAQRGLAPSRERARALILAGRVSVEGTRIDKAGTRVATSAAVDVKTDPNPYVSRGGLKLAAALDRFTVQPEETGIVQRFGNVMRTAGPGLHFKIPFGIETVRLVPTARVLKEEFGFRTVKPDVRTTYTKRGLEEESLTLTGDLNVSDVEWIVQFQVSDPFKFIFRIKDPVGTIRDIAEAMVRKAIGNANVTEVLTTERALLANEIELDLQSTRNDYDIGVRIVTVKFQDVNPPEQVKGAFNEVNEAEQQKESSIFQAREQFNREVPKARGEAKQALQQAAGYAIERSNKARGETNPESWTHGSSAQRVRWFKLGLEYGKMDRCDTFAADQL